MAILADTGATVLVTVNALRLLGWRGPFEPTHSVVPSGHGLRPETVHSRRFLDAHAVHATGLKIFEGQTAACGTSRAGVEVTAVAPGQTAKG
jgi:hypothetical protein